MSKRKWGELFIKLRGSKEGNYVTYKGDVPQYLSTFAKKGSSGDFIKVKAWMQ